MMTSQVPITKEEEMWPRRATQASEPLAVFYFSNPGGNYTGTHFIILTESVHKGFLLFCLNEILNNTHFSQKNKKGEFPTGFNTAEK